jgi:hypothetical protein
MTLIGTKRRFPAVRWHVGYWSNTGHREDLARRCVGRKLTLSRHPSCKTTVRPNARNSQGMFLGVGRYWPVLTPSGLFRNEQWPALRVGI